MSDSSAFNGQPPKFDLRAAFARKEAGLLNELGAGAEVAGHTGVQGQGTEDQWRTIFREILPARYQVSAAIVVDSQGGQSEQIDLVIRDAQYSPLFWKYAEHLYVPAESVYAVFEVKPKMNREYLLYTSKKIASVRKLARTSVSFGWALGAMPPRELPPILGGLLAAGCDWSRPFGTPFQRAMTVTDPNEQIDLGCILGSGAFEVPPGTTVPSVEVDKPESALVTFTLRLLHRLQGLGSAPGIDYNAYARWVEGRESTVRNSK
jgi:hypothetical protein